MAKVSPILVYILAIIVFILELSRQIIYIFTSVLIFEFYITASILISVAAVIIRLFIIDPHKFSTVILKTDILDSGEKTSEETLHPARFLNLMPAAMIICTVADYLITIDFIIGVLTFLVAQILYIIAISGIIHLNPKKLFTGKIKILSIFVSIGWILLTVILYFTLLYSPAEIMTLLLIPYIFVITLAAIIAFFALGYTNRSLKFRLMLCGGATFFYISDAIMGISIFNFSFVGDATLLSVTYLLAIFMYQFAILFLRSRDGTSITKD